MLTRQVSGVPEKLQSRRMRTAVRLSHLNGHRPLLGMLWRHASRSIMQSRVQTSPDSEDLPKVDLNVIIY